MLPLLFLGVFIVTDASFLDELPLQQCDPSNTCWCVDPKTKVELPGTRVNKKKRFHCRPENEYILRNEFCKLPKDAGTTCAQQSPMPHFYFDVATGECLRFEFAGCGGNKNRFHSLKECLEACHPPPGCRFQVQPLQDPFMCDIFPRKCKGDNVINCAQVHVRADCPRSHKCVLHNYGEIGSCCPREETELFEREALFECSFEKPTMHVGKRCADNICPSNMFCTEGEVFAFCCPHGTKVQEIWREHGVIPPFST